LHRMIAARHDAMLQDLIGLFEILDTVPGHSRTVHATGPATAA
jgi:hypothetical protein